VCAYCFIWEYADAVCPQEAAWIPCMPTALRAQACSPAWCIDDGCMLCSGKLDACCVQASLTRFKNKKQGQLLRARPQVLLRITLSLPPSSCLPVPRLACSAEGPEP
jgi:hypothetical protein